jgi:hypothetical protein
MVRSTLLIITIAASGLSSLSVCAALASQPASTQPVTAGRDTPAGAMMVYEHAIETADFPTIADSFNDLSEPMRQAVARELVLNAQFDKAVDARFGHDALLEVCKECRMKPEPTNVKYTNDMWNISQQQPDQAAGNWEPGKKDVATQFMQRGPDGIWRFGRYVSPAAHRRSATRAAAILAERGITTRPANPRIAEADQMIVRIQRALDGVTAGNLKSMEDVEHALYPEGTPMEQARKAEQEQKESDQQQEKQYEQKILAAHFDSSTLEGAIGAYVQAMTRRDPQGMADMIHVQNAPDNSYAIASVKRLFAIGEFNQAMMDHIDPKGSGLDGRFGLEKDAAFVPSLAWDRPQQHGDVGVITRGGEGQPAAWYRKMGDVWKQEVKLEVPSRQTLVGYIKDVEDDTAALKRVTADINAGKIMTEDKVRDALGNAGLNSFSDPTFTTDFEQAYPNQVKPHDRPKDAPAPNDPKTPAGAMNRFIRAVQSGDEATVRDCLWLPNDHNGVAAAAMAHDYAVGARFVRALQKDSPGWDPNYFCHNCDVIQPESLRDYSEDEWRIDPSHPDIAMSNEAIIGRPDPSNPQKRPSFTMVHEWTPIMHRGADSVWRLGPRYPASAHQLQEQTAMLAAKDQILDKATADLNADKVRAIEDLGNSIFPQLKAIGAAPVTTMQP